MAASTAAKFRLTPDLLSMLQEKRLEAPSVFEFAFLRGRLSDKQARARAGQLLDRFVHLRHTSAPLPDVWYGQLDSLFEVAEELGNKAACEEAFKFNAEIREMSKHVPVRNGKGLSTEIELFAQDTRFIHGTDSIPLDLSRPVPAIDPATMFLELKKLESVSVDPANFDYDIGFRSRVEKAGFLFEAKQLGKQHAVPTAEKLEEIKRKCIAVVRQNFAFLQALNSGTGAELDEFKFNVSQPFDLNKFYEVKEDNLSSADIYTLLPDILQHKHETCNPEFSVLKQLYSDFATFRYVFGSICNPFADYMPIFSAILDLLMKANPRKLQAIGKVAAGLFATLFAAVLDILACAICVGTTSTGAGACMTTGLALIASALFPEFMLARFIIGAGIFGAGLGSWFSPSSPATACTFVRNAAGAMRLFALSLL